MAKPSILFVCLGNICRSPMAEAVMRSLAPDLIIDSAGTAGYHEGSLPHHGTRKILDLHGISYEGQRARKVRMDDFERFTRIFAMDRENQSVLFNMGCNKAELFLANHPGGMLDVPDPYYTGNFEEVYHLIRETCEEILKKL